MKKVTDEQLEVLVYNLREYRARGIKDPWVIVDTKAQTEEIDPLDILEELQELRAVEVECESSGTHKGDVNRLCERHLGHVTDEAFEAGKKEGYNGGYEKGREDYEPST